MRRAALAVFFIILTIGGLADGHVHIQEIHAQGETDTPTPSQTPTLDTSATVTPSETATVTETSTPTATPNLYWVATAPSGQAVAIVYTMSGGEALIATLQMILIGFVVYGLFIALRKWR